MFRTRALITLVLCGLAVACSAPSAEVTDISQQDLLAAADGELLVVDVRTPEEFAGGHVPGAINIPEDEVAARLAEFGDADDRAVVVYCERGGRAGRAADVLVAAGFLDVRHLDGDMSGWRGAELPVE